MKLGAGKFSVTYVHGPLQSDCKFLVWIQVSPPFTQSGAWGRPQVPVTLRGIPEQFPSLFLGSSGQFLPTLPFDNKAGLPQDAGVLPHFSLRSSLSCLTVGLSWNTVPQIWREGVFSLEDTLGARRSMCKSDVMF